MDINAQYQIYIYERYTDLIAAGKTADTMTNNDLWKIFEYFSCIKLSEKYRRQFYEYNDITPDFKEENELSRNDTGIDCCDLRDTIVQCKLRATSLDWRECATFFGSQTAFSEQEQRTIVKWPNMVIARNAECKLSENLRHRRKIYTDVDFPRAEIIAYCENLREHPPKYPVEIENFALRGYQVSAIDSIMPDRNAIIALPTGTGKNVIIIHYILKNLTTDNTAKYLILVPRIVLMYQLADEFAKYTRELKNKIQLIGDTNNTFDAKYTVTICVYNSAHIVAAGAFTRIFIDEAHHIYKPEIYKIDPDDPPEDPPDTSNKELFDLLASIDNNVLERELADMNITENNIIEPPPKISAGKMEESDNDSDGDSTDNPDDIAEDIAESDQDSIYSGDSDDSADEYIESDDDTETSTLDEPDELINTPDDPEDPDDPDDELKKSTNYLTIIRGFAKLNNNVYLSATIDEIEGFSYYTQDIRTMIEQKYLCDYDIHVPIFSDDPTNANIAEHLLKDYKNCIIYCNTQREGREFNDTMNRLQPKSSEYLDCNTSRRDFARIINNFKSGVTSFLVNIRVLIDGFDAAITKSVCFLHMPKSKTTLIQIIGRALRLHPLKNIANIILPYSTSADDANINHFLKTISANDRKIKSSYAEKKLGGYISIETTGETGEISTDAIFKYTQIYNHLGELQNTDAWILRLEEVKKYIDENNKKPVSNDKNREIRSMGAWITKQIINYNTKSRMMKNEKIYDIWTEFITSCKYSKYFISNINEWKNNLIYVKKYIDIYNKRPSSCDKNNEIKHLGRWISTQIKNYENKKESMKIDEIYNLWTEFIKDEKYRNYFISNMDEWMSTLEKIKKYIDDNNITPSIHNINNDIKSLGRWIYTQTQNYKNKKYNMKNNEICEVWTNFISDSKYEKYFISNENYWIKNLKNTKKYIDDNNIIPSTRDINNEIKTLGCWLSHQKKNYKNKTEIMKNKEIYNLWADFISNPKYNKYFLSNEQNWINILEKVKKYIDDNNKKPYEKDKNCDIRTLGHWISSQNENYKNKTQIMKIDKIYNIWSNFITDEKYKIYLLSNEQNWELNLEKVKKYINDNNKKPTVTDKNILIKQLGKWLSHQSDNYKNKKESMKIDKIYNIWSNFINDEKYKNHLLSNEQNWKLNLENIKKYINDNNKKPSQIDINNNIKILGQWISSQIRNYKNKENIMKNEEIYNLWTEFITDEKYKKYF